MRGLTREFGIPFVVNDDVNLAHQVDADGVHLGATDTGVKAARAVLGSQKIIGVSCYNRLSLAREAIAAGADYVAFGAFFSSSVKPDAAKADAELLHQARAEFDVPLVAIGGITARMAHLWWMPARMRWRLFQLCLEAADIQAAAQEFSKLFIRKLHHDFT